MSRAMQKKEDPTEYLEYPIMINPYFKDNMSSYFQNNSSYSLIHRLDLVYSS